jgi:hypothetical protein
MGQLCNPANQLIPTPHDESPDLSAPCSGTAMSSTDLLPERVGACASSSPARPLMDVAQIWPVYHAATRQPRSRSAMASSVPHLEFNALIKSRC